MLKSVKIMDELGYLSNSFAVSVEAWGGKDIFVKSLLLFTGSKINLRYDFFVDKCGDVLIQVPGIEPFIFIVL